MLYNHRQLILSLISVFLLSCNSNYTVSTNLDSNNFKNYFSPTKVTIYQSEQDIPQHYQLIGVVEGEDCQLKVHHAAPDEINARTNARRQAFKLQANGIVFTSCTIINSPIAHQSPEKQQCLSTVVCYGKAYKVDLTKNEN